MRSGSLMTTIIKTRCKKDKSLKPKSMFKLKK